LAPQWVLSPMMAEMPGDCLALNGTSGYIDIKLRTRVMPTAFTLEHVDKSIAFNIERCETKMKQNEKK
jgi:SUN domain-containing protein 1/2